MISQPKTITMKKGILFLAFIFSSQIIFAQKEEWNKHFDLTSEAAKIDDDFYANPDASKIPAIIAKYQEALDLIQQVENKSSDYSDAAKIEKAYINKCISYLYHEIKDYPKQEEYANKAFGYWPYYNSLSKSAVLKHIEFTESDPFDKEYTEMLYLAVFSAYRNGNYSRIYEMEKLYEPVKKGIQHFNEWLIIYDIARTYQNDSNNSDEKAKHWVAALEKGPALSSENKEKNKGPFDFMVKHTGNMITNDNNIKLRGAKALYANEKYVEANKLYSSYAKSTSSPSLDAGWDYSESAMKEPDKTDARNAVNIIEQHTSGFSEYEWERLQKVYEFIGDTEKAQGIKSKIEQARRKAEEERRLQAQRDEEERKRREKEERKRDARGRFSVAVSTNPFMYIWNDYPVALDIRIGRVVNEFRVNFARTREGKTDKYHYGQWRSDGAAKDFGYKFSGMEYSYTLKILLGNVQERSKGRRKEVIGGYVGFQPRYSMYDFNTEIVNFENATTHFIEPYTVNASATRYDFCIMGGFLGDNLGGFFHIDYYFGVGVGYRTFDISSPDAGFNYDNYTFNNNGVRRYDPDRWNKIYVPVRFGFRMGINLL